MSKESLEHLSSLMDGEMSSDSGLFLTRRLASDETLCATWERYHLIRDCIRKPGSKHLVTGMSLRLSASLDAEQIVSVPAWRNNRWLKPLSGFAIAASVALVAIVVTAPQTGTSTAAADAVVNSEPVNQPFVSPNTVAITAVSQAASYSPANKPRVAQLNAYLLRHNQMAGVAGRQGFVSFVPIVATQLFTQAEQDPLADDEQNHDSVDSMSTREAAANK